MFDQLDDPMPFVPDDVIRASVGRRARALRRRRTGRRVALAGLVPVLAVGGLAARVGWGLDHVQRVHVAGLTGPDPVGTDRPTTVLIMGTDHSATDPTRAEVIGARSDTILVVRIDPGAGRVAMVSIPRDLWTGSEKVNALPPAALVNWLATTMGIHVDHYLSLDMDGFARIAGRSSSRVRLDHPVRDRTTGLSLDAGCQRLSGPQSLAYVRSRHLQELGADNRWQNDPTGDLGREARTRALLTAAWAQLRQLGPADLPSVVDNLRSVVMVDDQLSSTDLVRLGRLITSADAPTATELPVASGTVAPTGAGATGGQSVLTLEPGVSTDAALATVGGRLRVEPSTSLVTTIPGAVAVGPVDPLGVVTAC